MRSIRALARAAALAVLAIGVLLLATPAMADTGAGAGPVPIAKPTSGTAPHGGTPAPVVGGSEPGTLAGTGPSRPIIELALLGTGLLVVGTAINRAGRKSQSART